MSDVAVDWSRLLCALPADTHAATRAYLSDRRLARIIFAGGHTHPLVYDRNMILHFKPTAYTRFIAPAIDERALFERALRLRSADALQLWLKYLRHAGTSLANYLFLADVLAERGYCVVCETFFTDNRTAHSITCQ